MAQLLVALAPEKMVLLFNDKYFRERKASSAFVRAQFDASYDATWIPARPGEKSEGQANGDSFYLPPHTVLLKRRDVP